MKAFALMRHGELLRVRPCDDGDLGDAQYILTCGPDADEHPFWLAGNFDIAEAARNHWRRVDPDIDLPLNLFPTFETTIVQLKVIPMYVMPAIVLGQSPRWGVMTELVK